MVLDESPPAMLTLVWTIAERIQVAFTAPQVPTDLGRTVALLDLHALDGTPFRILGVQPELVNDLKEDARQSHRIDVDLEQWILAGSPTWVSILTDHPWAARFLVRMDDLAPAKELRPLARAVRSSDLSEVRRLVFTGADLDAKDPDWVGGRSALHGAAEGGRPDLLHVLADAGADLEATDRFGRTPFLVAAAQGSVDMLKALHAAGANASAKDAAGRSAVELARLRSDSKGAAAVEWLASVPRR